MSEEKKIFKAISDAMADIDAIGKTSKNKQQGFMFRGIDDTYNQLHPVMVKHRIFSVPEVITDKHEERATKAGGHLIYRILTVRYTFYTDDGSSIAAVVIGEGMDSGDKAASKAMSIAHKYALMQVFCIPTVDLIDPDYETQPESVPTETPEERLKNGREAIESKIEKNKDILDPKYIDSIRMDAGAVKTPEELEAVWEDMKQTVTQIRAKETKARTEDAFTETAAKVFKGEVVAEAKVPEVLQKEIDKNRAENDAGEGFKDDTAELGDAVKKNGKQQDLV